MTHRIGVAERDQIRTLAEALLGRDVRSVSVAGRGANSRVYRVEDTAGRHAALKRYPPVTDDDPRDRLAIEVAALRFLESEGVDSVPRVLAANPARSTAILSWVDGEVVTQPGDRDIELGLGFLERVLRLGDAAGAQAIAVAPRPCLCGTDIVDQIGRHEARLVAAAKNQSDLAAFLGDEFIPVRAAAITAAETAARRNNIPFDQPLERDRQAMFQGDFGFHNALRAADNVLGFIDFEYFGWDDPVKLIADLLLHPGNGTTTAQRNSLARGVREILNPRDPTINVRLDSYLGLFRLRWALIALNIFLARPASANPRAGATSNAEARQIETSRKMLKSTVC